MMPRIKTILNMYEYIAGNRRDAREILLDHDEVERKISISGMDETERDKKMKEITIDMISKLNAIISQLDATGIARSTGSTAIFSFVEKHGMELETGTNVFSSAIKRFPSRLPGDLDLESMIWLFHLAEECKVVVKSVVRDAIVAGMIDGHVPEWVIVLVQTCHFIDGETRDLLAHALKRD